MTVHHHFCPGRQVRGKKVKLVLLVSSAVLAISLTVIGWVWARGIIRDRALMKVVPGMRVEEVENLLGEPEGRFYPPFRESYSICSQDAEAMIVYSQGSATVNIFLDKGGHVLCESVECCRAYDPFAALRNIGFRKVF